MMPLSSHGASAGANARFQNLVPVATRFVSYIEPALGCLQAKGGWGDTYNQRSLLKNWLARDSEPLAWSRMPF